MPIDIDQLSHDSPLIRKNASVNSNCSMSSSGHLAENRCKAFSGQPYDEILSSFSANLWRVLGKLENLVREKTCDSFCLISDFTPKHSFQQCFYKLRHCRQLKCAAQHFGSKLCVLKSVEEDFFQGEYIPKTS